MGILGTLLLVVGGIVALIGGIMVLIEAFKESVGWGLGSLLVPVVSLVFVVLHWSVAKKGFLLYLAGIGLIVVGAICGAMGAASAQPAP